MLCLIFKKKLDLITSMGLATFRESILSGERGAGGGGGRGGD